MRTVFLAVLTLVLSSCVRIGQGSSMQQACSGAEATSRLVVLLNAKDRLPPVLAGQINDTIAIDECQNNGSYLYTITRLSPYSAQIQVWLPPSNKTYDTYFDQNQMPKPDPTVDYTIYGRPYCDSDNLTMVQGSARLEWQPLETLQTCATSGYTATIQAE